MRLASEAIAIVATIDPDVTVASTVVSDWVAMADWETILAVVLAGTLGSSATLDAKLEQATDSSGSGAIAITGKAITQLTDGGSDSDKQALINCTGAELDVAGGFTHVRLSMTVATATSDVAGLIIGQGARYGPASDNDLATVDEIVN